MSKERYYEVFVAMTSEDGKARTESKLFTNLEDLWVWLRMNNYPIVIRIDRIC